MGTWQNWLEKTKLTKYDDGTNTTLKPLWTVNLEDDEAVLQWHTNIQQGMEEVLNRRTAMYTRNRDLYMGLHMNARRPLGEKTDPLGGWGTSKFSIPEVVINLSYELTEQWVAKLSRFSTTVDVLPKNAEEGDRNKARAAQRFANHLADINDFKGMFLKFIRDSKIGGESFIVIDFDPNKGDLHPDAKKAIKRGMRVPLLDESGNKVMGEDGEPLYIEERKRVGDLVYRHRSVPEVLYQPKKKWRDVEWFREVDLIDIDELKRLYPSKANKIDNEQEIKSTGVNKKTGDMDFGNSALVYTYWHKGTEALDSGRKIVCTDNTILFNDVNPFSGAPLPVVRLTDIDIEGEVSGWSFLNNMITPQLILNKLYTLWYTNVALGSHLYWLVPANARIARDKIRNSSSVIMYNGTQKPEIAVFRTVSSDLLSLIDKIEQRMLTVSRIQSTSRGELPPNVEAGVAISILEEQENQAATPDIKKVNAAVEKLFKISLGIAGDMFDENDGRTARILGKEGEFLLETLDTAKLSGPYDIRVKKATAFSQSKPLMIKEITQLEAMRPGILSDEELYDLLDLGDRDKFYDIVTAARRAAEFENEKIKDGEDIPEPTEDEFLLVHWDSHVTTAQAPSWKFEASKESRDIMEGHVSYTEFLLVEKAKRNPKLTQKLMDLEYFPVYYMPRFSLTEIAQSFQTGQLLPLEGEDTVPEDQPSPEQIAAQQVPTDLAPQDIPQEQLPPGGSPDAIPQPDNGVPPEPTTPNL